MSDADRSDWSAYLGWYATFGFAIEVRVHNGELVAAVPGVPPGYEITMEPLGDHRFRMLSGPVLGALATFRLGAAGVADAILVGPEELIRVPAGQIPAPQPYQNLRAPHLEIDAAREQAFAALFQSILVCRDGGWIDYELAYPKHEFLRYVSNQQAVLFHGSNRSDIDEFQPRRLSYELRDRSGRGNYQAVYATHDGLWAMFFAIVDRARLTGSIRNGVTYYHNRAGEPIALYHFSINREQLDEQPWCTGALYFLPRDTFFQVPLAGEALSNEWASPVAVKPLARLRLEPEEFPFLHQIGGHDDQELQRFGQLRKRLLGAVTDVQPLSEGLELTLDWSPDLEACFPEFLALQQTILPAASFTLIVQDKARLVIRGPAAFMQVLQDELDKVLSRPSQESG